MGKVSLKKRENMVKIQNKINSSREMKMQNKSRSGSKSILLTSILFISLFTLFFAGAGFAVCPTSITSNTVLTEDCSTGITIDASGVTLDCAGYAINYSRGHGISAANKNNIIIKNCNLSRVWPAGADNVYGISFSGTSNSVIFNNTILVNDNAKDTGSTRGHGISLSVGSNYNDVNLNSIQTRGGSAHGIALSGSS